MDEVTVHWEFIKTQSAVLNFNFNFFHWSYSGYKYCDMNTGKLGGNITRSHTKNFELQKKPKSIRKKNTK